MYVQKLSQSALCATALLLLAQGCSQAWEPKQAPIMTKWAAQVDPKMPWPDYPRPQFVRKEWLNLNGIWQYQSGAQGDSVPTGRALSSEILVPYPVESALSGVMEHHDRLWYRRTFVVPSSWKGKEVLLNFGAVDFESEVYVNGKSIGIHRGGYLPFTYDVTRYLTGSGPQELIVRVYNAVDLAGEPRGKQTTHPGGIMYTPSTGIWQTVWLEPVSPTHISDIKIVPDIDAQCVKVTVSANGPGNPTATVAVEENGKVLKTISGNVGAELTIPIDHEKLWSPDTPFLYDLDVKLSNNGVTSDHVRSYFGMRKISIGLDKGVKKMFLNNRFRFEIGPLDQGFWPDGIYTQPNEAALKNDIQTMKTLGFNMVRKHIKVEPARWYYWTDKLGLLVWQDMPSMDSYLPNNVVPPPTDKPEFEAELLDLVKTHWNSPSIIMWDIFNEAQGQFDTARLVNEVKTLDPSRLVDQASGGAYFDAGDVLDLHSYPPPGAPVPSATQALVCGEYGGIGYLVKGHIWTPNGGGYTNVKSGTELQELYSKFSNDVQNLRDNSGLSAAVYTQLTDVETELNGLMTYDRILKCDPAKIALANQLTFPPTRYVEVVPTSEKASQTWRYTLAAPPADWTTIAFDDASWTAAPGGFGNGMPPDVRTGTPWLSPDIWLRRTVSISDLTPELIKDLVIRDWHDEDIDLYINGVLAYSASGYITSYEYGDLTQDGKRALLPNALNTLAVHCHQTVGGQYIDAGLFDKIVGKR